MNPKIREKMREANLVHKSKKIAVVIFITLLIWVWADLSLDAPLRYNEAAIAITSPADPTLWVRFENDSRVLEITDLRMTGPFQKVAEIKREIHAENPTAMGSSPLFQFTLDPDNQGMTEAKEYVLDVKSFIQQTKQMKNLGLRVIESNPEQTKIIVSRLVRKRLQVKCYDENTEIRDAVIKPDEIIMPVPGNWEGEQLIARVQLTNSQILRARKSPIDVRPYVKIGLDTTRNAASLVTVKLPEEQKGLQIRNVQPATIGYILSGPLLGKYDVEVINKHEFNTIRIKATEAAFEAYQKQRYKMLLEIVDEDVRTGPDAETAIYRDLIYNFPKEFVQKNEIMPAEELVPARFRLNPAILEP